VEEGPGQKESILIIKNQNSLIKKIAEVREICAEKAIRFSPGKRNPGAIDHQKRGWRVLY